MTVAPDDVCVCGIRYRDHTRNPAEHLFEKSEGLTYGIEPAPTITVTDIGEVGWDE